jgi:Fe-S-cluster-containing dehydrogenase component
MLDEKNKKQKKSVPVWPVPMTKGVLAVDQELCSGCMMCVLTCSLKNQGVGSFSLSRIYMAAYTKYEFDGFAEPCQQCVDPLCLRDCPFAAIVIDEKTGARVIDEKLCTGCKICLRSCPYKPPRISFNRETKKALKCTLCDGDPACVKACPTAALTYMTNPNGIHSGFKLLPEGI